MTCQANLKDPQEMGWILGFGSYMRDTRAIVFQKRFLNRPVGSIVLNK